MVADQEREAKDRIKEVKKAGHGRVIKEGRKEG
jgi:hypothetical protein